MGILTQQRFFWICAPLCLIAVILLQYANNSASTPQHINLLQQLPRGVVLLEEMQQFRKGRHKPVNRIETVTGYSYEARMSRMRVFKCPPNNTTSKVDIGKWHQPRSTNLFVKSAFLDDRIHKQHPDRHYFIRVLSMNEGTLNYNVYCQFQFTHTTNSTVSVEAQATEIWFSKWDQQSRNRIYKPYLLTCKVPRHIQGLSTFSDTHVSVTKSPCDSDAKTAVPILNSELPQARKWFAVCVKPLDFHNDISKRLLEWVELQFILGADHIDFNVFRVHPNVEKVLRFYESKGKASVYPITLPGQQPNFPPERTSFLRRNIWQKRRNELIPYNECFYRHLNSHRYVIPLDIDEVILPKIHQTWNELLSSNVTSRNAASYSVRNAYFLDQLGQSDEKVHTELHTLSHVYRIANFSEPSHFVKSFVSTDKALLVFNHYALKSMSSGVERTVELPLELAQMNHYRERCPSTMTTRCQDFLRSKVKDTTIYKYRLQLESRVATMLQELGEHNS